MGLLYGRTGCLTAQNGGFRPGQSNQFFAAILVSVVFLCIDASVMAFYDVRCNALKILTSMSMVITLLCGFASKLDATEAAMSEDTLGWILICANFIIVLLILSIELMRRLLSIYAGVRHGIAYVKNTETVCPLTGIVTYEGHYHKAGQEQISVAVNVFPLHKYTDAQLVHSKIQDMGIQPHISQIHGSEVERGHLYVATQPLQSTLDDHLKEYHTCPISATELCTSLIQGVKAVHDQNIAIRNIRPERLALDGCQIQLMEFSQARSVDTDNAIGAADLHLDKQMLACTILYTLSGGLDGDGKELDFDELMSATDSTTDAGFPDKVFGGIKADRLGLADLLRAVMDRGSSLESCLSRPFFWGREQTVAYLADDIGNLLDPSAASTSPQSAFLEALEAAGDAQLDGGYDEALKQAGPSWSALLDEDYPLTQNSPKDPTGWGKSQAPPAEVEHDYAVYGQKSTKKQVSAREQLLSTGKKPKMGNRRMVGLLKMIRNVAFAHRSQNVQAGRFETEEDVMRYVLDPFPWLLMEVYTLDQEHAISSSKGLAKTGSERDTDAMTTHEGSTSMSDTGMTTDDGESKPKSKKPDNTKTGAKTENIQKRASAPNKKSTKQAAKDANTIQLLKGAVTKQKEEVTTQKEEVKRLQEEIKILKETAAAPGPTSAAKSAPEAKAAPVPTPESTTAANGSNDVSQNPNTKPQTPTTQP
jgi:hypothetical protein